MIKRMLLFYWLCLSPSLLYAKLPLSAEWLERQDLHGLQKAMAEGDFSSRDLTEFYLERIKQIDNGKEGLHAVIRVASDALLQAEKMDALRTKGQIKGSLHGIPVLLKDNIDTADGMPNTAGSILLLDNFPQRDAPLVERLREAGAVILGKANLSEWANFRSTHSSSGWSGVGGQARNPYDKSRSPCGSSAGSGIAVSANLATLAVGTETDGSIACPSAVNGIVGIKPTVGVVSQQGIIPISRSQDTAGPMAKSVTDAVLMLEAMDTREQPELLSRHLVSNGLKDKRIGLVNNLTGYLPELDKIFADQSSALIREGAKVVDCPLETAGKWDEFEWIVLLHEFRADLNKYLEKSSSKYKSLASLIEGNQQHWESELLVFAQEIFEEAENKKDANGKLYAEALEKSRTLAGKDGIDAAMNKCQVDILLAPTTSPAWKIDHILGDHFLGSGYSAAAVAGYPSITVPMGFVDDLPVGMTFYSGAFNEGALIEAAYAYEQASRQRRMPPIP